MLSSLKMNAMKNETWKNGLTFFGVIADDGFNF